MVKIYSFLGLGAGLKLVLLEDLPTFVTRNGHNIYLILHLLTKNGTGMSTVRKYLLKLFTVNIDREIKCILPLENHLNSCK